MTITIDALQVSDWDAVRTIYLEGIATGNATLETQAPDWETWDRGHLPHSRLIARRDGQVLGWAVLSRVSGRCVYGGVASVSVYIAAAARGQGVGKTLLHALIDESEQHGIWTLEAGILRENAASRALHAACGFREVGYRERLGQLNGQWRDVILMEHRSHVAGM